MTRASRPARVLLLGGSGFVGSRLIKILLRSDEWLLDAPDSRQCDLTDPGSVSFLRDRLTPESAVIFCSAVSRVRDDSLGAFHKNVLMAENVASAISAAGCGNLLFCSSVDVYGRPPSENPLTEDSPLNPAGYYGHAKLVSEYILQRQLGGVIPVAILRLPGVCALDDGDNSAPGTIFNAIRRGESVQLSGGGRHRRTYLHVDDLAALSEVICRERWFGTMNLGGPDRCSLFELATTFREFLGSASAIVKGEPNGTEFDIEVAGDKLRGAFPNLRFRSMREHLQNARCRSE